MSDKHKNVSSLGGTHLPTRDVNAAQRVALAVKLRATRMTYEQIAKQAGYSNASSCRKAVMRELDRCVVRNVEALRTEELDSLDRLEQECWKRLYDKKYEQNLLYAVDRINAIKERRARLMGLDIAKDANVAANQVIVRELPAHYLDMTQEVQQP